ncbi:MAG TPA: DUF512 domain-containing protein [Clostridia bacterium]|nr:DUF512 domain-containing protein [Clostridia bacterium]
MAKITALSKIAKRLGLRVGDELIAFDGHRYCDILDCLYYDAQEKFTLEIKRFDKLKTLKIDKNAEDALGLEIDEELSPIRCKNKCQFCFVDQLPCGMRDMLYVKDDDYRFSFISGSYVTLSNITEEEIERIIRLKLSPIYISVHAYDDEIRLKLEKNPNSKNLITILKRLGNGGIKMHTQIVMVPDINDGAVVEDTIVKLKGIVGVKTVAVVPVGLTKHRNGLPNLMAVDEVKAAETIDIVEKLYEKFDGFCWCSDEFYLRANRTVPKYDYYGAFDQIENGVGLIADFKANFDYALSECKDLKLDKKIGFITGVSFAPLLKDFAKEIEKKLGVKIEVWAIKNTYFGESVTVAGLVTATDIISQVKTKDTDGFIIPSNMLKEFSTVFLDDISLADLENSLGKKVLVASESGDDLLKKIIEL